VERGVTDLSECGWGGRGVLVCHLSEPGIEHIRAKHPVECHLPPSTRCALGGGGGGGAGVGVWRGGGGEGGGGGGWGGGGGGGGGGGFHRVVSRGRGGCGGGGGEVMLLCMCPNI